MLWQPDNVGARANPKTSAREAIYKTPFVGSHTETARTLAIKGERKLPENAEATSMYPAVISTGLAALVSHV